MDAVSYVETARSRICLKSTGLSLEDSKCDVTFENLVKLNWNLLSGDTATEAVIEFSAFLEAHPESELTEPFGLTFADIFPHVFVAMCDSYRRLCLPAKQLKFAILEIGLMTVEDAAHFLVDLALQPKCCSGQPLVQVGGIGRGQ